MKYSTIQEYQDKHLIDGRRFPWEHWYLKDFFSIDYLKYFKAIFPEDLDPDLVYDANRSALRFTRNNCAKFPFLEKIVQFFKEPDTVSFFEKLSKKGFFKDCYVRIDYTIDHPGYHLPPHLDRHSKLLTLQIYLPEQEEAWGTEIYNNEMTLCETVPFMRNCGHFFFPGIDRDKPKWHGVTRPVTADRPSLLVNYMTKPELLNEVKGDDRPDGTNVTLASGANVWEDWWSL
tara:strand:- start:154 stop:846 length:693 start_codon:yes stop_codon:yes gene_type:complete